MPREQAGEEQDARQASTKHLLEFDGEAGSRPVSELAPEAAGAPTGVF